MGLFDRIKKAFTGEDPIVTDKQETAEEKEEQIVFEKYDKGVEKTRKTFSERINELFAGFREVDEDFFDDLEETLISSDVGFDMTIALSDAVREEIQLKNARSGEEVKNTVVEKMIEIYDKGESPEVEINESQTDDPTVMLFVGVNGVGKTTTIGKIAYQLKAKGKKVLLVAGDTFRAGAVEQLEEWAQRVDVPIVLGRDQGDPASVVFDGVKRAKAEGFDYLLVDTAGRLQNKANLMAELDKMNRVIQREIPDGPHETLLVLDATTGQNALQQAKEFAKVVNITGIILTKMDGTGKGGVIFAIRYELDIPVKFIGLGEQLDDLQKFDPEQFIYQMVRDVVEVQ
ncbi:signal recognition particle-docking protein FtsY [Aerococcus sp. UMB1112A]|uniref:signal recognition particle-docking protein FtsY n=1 Tax=unclassified Aerococcus TaxID=2618060 RepID=UPI00254C987E|nr:MULTISPECIES: signal recognition particle-docking protein FtsY [unclassified Aerococcus]MDK6804483.1 signal recognition particle-docking protein FtsY [Aerococcus sp. UMB7834]MDK8502945.1 signal recognition particle-docking protein FtsY [Aerococcus sp. UMB1112A]